MVIQMQLPEDFRVREEEAGAKGLVPPRMAQADG